MALDPRWKFPQGKSPEHLHDCLYQIIRELRKGDYLVSGVPVGQEVEWTPTLTFATPGDLAVTYSARLGSYVRIGNLALVNFAVATSAFTHTTASGNCRLTGLPINNDNTQISSYGSLVWGGITKANYTDIASRITNAAGTIEFRASGSGQAASMVAAADMPSGGSVLLTGNIAMISL